MCVCVCVCVCVCLCMCVCVCVCVCLRVGSLCLYSHHVVEIGTAVFHLQHRGRNIFYIEVVKQNVPLKHYHIFFISFCKTSSS